MIINSNKLFVKHHLVNEAKATIIISHGIAENSNRYMELVNELNINQYSVVRYDLRGHGQSNGKRGKLKSYHQLVDDLRELVKIEKAKKPRKLFILGHSMGGLLVNLYVAKYGKEDIDGVISSAAPTHYVNQVKPLRFTGYKWLSFIRIKTPFKNGDLSRIKEVELDYKKDPLNLRYIYISLVGGMMVGGVRYLNKRINNFSLPIIYLHGSEDNVVPPEFSERMMKIIPSEDKELVIYQDSVHEILNDLDQKKVRSDIIDWLERHI